MPFGGCPPASNCIEMEITSRMPSGQNAPADGLSPGWLLRGCVRSSCIPAEAFAGVAALNTIPAASMPAPLPAYTRKFRRFTLALRDVVSLFIADLLIW